MEKGIREPALISAAAANAVAALRLLRFKINHYFLAKCLRINKNAITLSVKLRYNDKKCNICKRQYTSIIIGGGSVEIIEHDGV